MKGRRCPATVVSTAVPTTRRPPQKCERRLEGAPGSASRETVYMERSRREKMNELYAVLQSVVPNLFPKAPRARIVDETINYIEELEGTIREMEAAKKAKKKARMSRAGSSIAVTVSGKMAFFGVTSTWRPGLAAQILQVFDRHNAEVLASTAACDGRTGAAAGRSMSVSVTVTTDEAAVEAMEEELTLMLS